MNRNHDSKNLLAQDHDGSIDWLQYSEVLSFDEVPSSPVHNSKNDTQQEPMGPNYFMNSGPMPFFEEKQGKPRY